MGLLWWLEALHLGHLCLSRQDQRKGMTLNTPQGPLPIIPVAGIRFPGLSTLGWLLLGWDKLTFVSLGLLRTRTSMVWSRKTHTPSCYSLIHILKFPYYMNGAKTKFLVVPGLLLKAPKPGPYIERASSCLTLSPFPLPGTIRIIRLWSLEWPQALGWVNLTREMHQ